MPAFPQLKTGAVLQYPARRSVHFATHVVRFLDGSEQRFRSRRSPRRRWIIRLDLLDDDEMSRLEDFFVALQGQCGSFEFSDPWDEIVYPDCSFENGSMERAWAANAAEETVVIVKENEV